jgi:hypothetical protein
MRNLAWIVVALSILAGTVLLGCTATNGNPPDGGAGSGGSGAGGSGGAGPTDGAIIDTGYVGCVDAAPTACPSPAVTYGNVEPIFQARCVNVCHNGTTPDPTMPGTLIWGFTDYEHVVSWQDTIRPAIINCTMPPVDAGVPLTVEERWAILEFIRCGAPK